MAILGVNTVTGMHCKCFTRDAEPDITPAAQMHFDTRLHVIPAHVVDKGVHGNVAIKFPVYAVKQV